MLLARSARLGAFAISLLVWGAACGGGTGGGAARHGRPLGRARTGGTVVATVDGVGISIGDVTRVVRETGLAPRTALRRLEDERLLAAEAARRGYRRRPAVRRAVRRAMVQALLARAVEDRVTPESVRSEQVRRRWQSVRDALGPDAGVPPLEQARPAIRRTLVREGRTARVESLVSSLARRYRVRRNEPAIERALRSTRLDHGHEAP